MRGLPSGPDRSENSAIKTARILYDGVPLKVRLAKMPTSWGLSSPMNAERSNQPFRLELSMGRNPEDTGIFKLCKFIDDIVRKNAEENSKDYLFKRTFSADLVGFRAVRPPRGSDPFQFEERYKGPALRFSKDKMTGEIKDYPPFIRMNVPVAPDGMNFQVDGFFSAERKPITVTVQNASSQISRNDQ